MKRNMEVYFLLHLFFFFCASETHIENQLREYLLRNHTSKLTRPVRNSTTTTIVTFNVKLMQVLSVEERDQKVTSQVYYSMHWKNELLKWQPEHWGNIDRLPVRPGDVWIPDIILKNNVDSDSAAIQKDTDNVWLLHDGRNSWYPKVMLKSSFKSDIKNFPFDKQKFIFHFGSWSLGKDKLRITKDSKPMIAKYYLNSTEWKLTKMEKEIVHSQYSDSYSDIVFTYFFTRKSLYGVITGILPSVMLMTVVLFSYVLPPNRTERIGVLVTALLAFTVFLEVINSSLPRTSDSVPTLKLFYLVTMAECIMCYFATCLTIRFSEEINEKTLYCLPSCLQTLIFRTNANKMTAKPHCSFACDIENCVEGNTSEKDSDIVSTVSEFASKHNSVVPLESVTANIRESNSAPTGSRGGRGIKDDRNEIARKILVRFIDKMCLYFFTILFIITSLSILMSAYNEA